MKFDRDYSGNFGGHMFPELKRLIEQMGKDKGINKQIIIEALETAMLTAAKKKLGLNADIEAHYNEEAGEIIRVDIYRGSKALP